MKKIMITKEESSLLLLYCGEDLTETIGNLQCMKEELSSHERGLRQLTDSLTGKLEDLKEDEYQAMLVLADDVLLGRR